MSESLANRTGLHSKRDVGTKRVAKQRGDLSRHRPVSPGFQDARVPEGWGQRDADPQVAVAYDSGEPQRGHPIVQSLGYEE